MIRFFKTAISTLVIACLLQGGPVAAYASSGQSGLDGQAQSSSSEEQDAAATSSSDISEVEDASSASTSEVVDEDEIVQQQVPIKPASEPEEPGELTEGETFEIPVAGTADVAPVVLNVTVPTELPFTMDPYEVNKRGTLFSDDFVIENRSPVDVLVTLTPVTVNFDGAGEVVLRDTPYQYNEKSTKKEVYMLFEFGDKADGGVPEEAPEEAPPPEGEPGEDVTITGISPDELETLLLTGAEPAELPPVRLAAAVYDEAGNFVEVAEGGRLVFRLTGSINPEPETDWMTGDVTIQMSYFIGAARRLPSEETEDIPEEVPAEEDAAGQAEQEDTSAETSGAGQELPASSEVAGEANSVDAANSDIIKDADEGPSEASGNSMDNTMKGGD